MRITEESISTHPSCGVLSKNVKVSRIVTNLHGANLNNNTNDSLIILYYYLQTFLLQSIGK
jgi:hypothetical protein